MDAGEKQHARGSSFTTCGKGGGPARGGAGVVDTATVVVAPVEFLCATVKETVLLRKNPWPQFPFSVFYFFK